jgi:hypothetical protein
MLSDIMEVTGCTTDCKDCGTDQSVAVIPTASSNLRTFVDSPGGTVTVTSTVVGDDTTYHLAVSATIQNLLASLFNTVITTGTSSFLTITNSTSGITRTYNIDFNSGAITLANRFFVRAKITYNGVSPYFDIATDAIAEGTAFDISSVLYRLGASSPNVFSDNAIFYIDQFLATTTTKYMVLADVMFDNTIPVYFINRIFPEVHYDQANPGDSLQIRFVDPVNRGMWTLFDLFTILSPTRKEFTLNLTIYTV